MVDKKDFDRDELDDDLDIPELDFDNIEGDEKRKPIQRAGGGFLSGVRNNLLDRSTQRQIIRRTFPSGYSAAFDLAHEIRDTGRDLYDAAAEQLEPVKRDAQNVLSRAAQTTEGYVPEAVTQILRDISRQEKDERPPSIQADPESQKVDRVLEDVFGEQQKQEAQREERDFVRGMHGEALENERHYEKSEQLDLIRRGISRLVGYQDTVTERVQRKSLELQQRHLFVARNQYVLLQGFAKETKTQLDAISNNTALPESLKITNSEALRRELGARAYSSLADAIQGQLKGVRERATEKVRGLAGQVAGGISGISSGMEMAEGLDIDGYQTGGEMAGTIATTTGAPALARRLGGRIGQIPGVQRLGQHLNIQTQDPAQRLRDTLGQYTQASEDPEAGFTDRAQGAVAGFLQSLIPGYSAEHTYTRDPLKEAEQGAPFTKRTDRAITEVIPSLLTEILHETESIRAGEQVERRRWDPYSGQLQRESQIERQVADQILPEKSIENLRARTNKIIDTLDPDGELDDKSRSSLMRQILADVAHGRSFDPIRLLDGQNLGQVEDPEHRRQIQHVVSTTLADDDTALQTRSQTISDFRSARSDIPNYKESMERLSSIYAPQMLEQAGITRSTDRLGEQRFDVDRFLHSVATGDALPRREAQVSAQRDTSRMTLDRSPIDEGEGRSASMSDFQRLADAIYSIDSNERLDQTNEWLRKIHDILDGGTPPPSSPPPSPSPSNDDGPDLDHRERSRRIRKRAAEQIFSQDRRRIAANEPSEDESVSEPMKMVAGSDIQLANQGSSTDELVEAINKQTDRLEQAQVLSTSIAQSPVSDVAAENPRYARTIFNRLTRFAGRENRDQLNQYSSNFFGASRIKRQFSASDQSSQADDQTEETLNADQPDQSEKRQSRFSSLGSRISGWSSKISDRAKSTKESLSERISDYRDQKLEQDRQRQESSEEDVSQKPRRSIGEYLKDTSRSFGQYAKDGSDTIRQSDPYAALSSLSIPMIGAATQSPSISYQLQNLPTFAQGLGVQAREQYRSTRARFDRGDQQHTDQDTQNLNLQKSGIEQLLDNISSKDAANVDRQDQDPAMRRHESMIEFLDEKFYEVIEAIRSISVGGDSAESAPGMMGHITSGVGKGIGGIFNYYGKALRGLGSAVGGAGRGVGSVLGGIGSRIGSMIRPSAKTKDPEQDKTVEDVYLKGYKQPVLRARDLEAGRYFDRETGKRIESIDDIESGVVDDQGNEILTPEEIDNDQLETRSGTSVKGIIGSIASGYLRYTTKPTRMVANVIKGLFDRVRESKDQPRDIYVLGEDRPRMLALIMRNGGYFSKATGEPITNINQIDGEVLDRDGNVVLSVEDIATGLRDSRGKKIDNLKGKAGDLLSMGFSGLKSYYKGVYKLGRGALSRIGRMLGLSGKDDKSATGGVGQIPEHIEQAILESRDYLSSISSQPQQLPTRDIGERIQANINRENEEHDRQLEEDRQIDQHLRSIRDISLSQDQKLEKIEALLRKKEGYMRPEDEREGRWQDMIGDGDSRREEGMPEHEDRNLADAEHSILPSFSDMLSGAGSALGRIGEALGIGAGARALLGRGGGRGGVPTGGQQPPGGQQPGGQQQGGRGGRLSRMASGARSAAGRVARSGAGRLAAALPVAGKALAGGAAAVGGAISAPVVATVAGVALVGIGAWLAYRHLSSDNVGPIGAFRVAQYGFDVGNDDHEKAIGLCAGLEKKLKDHVEIKDGQAQLSSSFSAKKLFKELEIDMENDEAMEKLTKWLRRRFLPVYFTHLVNAEERIDSRELENLDDELSDYEKANYLGAVLYPDQGGLRVYAQTTSPVAEPPELLDVQDVRMAYRRSMSRLELTDEEREKLSAEAEKRRDEREAQREQEKEDKKAEESEKSKDKDKDKEKDSSTPSSEKSKDPKKEDQESSSDESREEQLDEDKRRQEKIAKETATQTADRSSQIADRMDEVAGVLRQSYKVQKQMAQSLEDIKVLMVDTNNRSVNTTSADDDDEPSEKEIERIKKAQARIAEQSQSKPNKRSKATTKNANDIVVSLSRK